VVKGYAGVIDADLVAGWQAGDDTMARVLVERHSAVVHRRLGWFFWGDPLRVEDLAQETWWRAFRSLHRFDPTHPFINWLLAITTRVAVTGLSTIRTTDGMPRLVTVADPGLLDRRNAPDPAQAVADRDQLQRAVAMLPPAPRDAFVLVHIHDVPRGEAACILGISPNTLYQRLHRAYATLASLISAPEDQPTPHGHGAGRQRNDQLKRHTTAAALSPMALTPQASGEFKAAAPAQSHSSGAAAIPALNQE
jgi:RNA polymerase sigma-70 factor (ECF subfamily)